MTGTRNITREIVEESRKFKVGELVADLDWSSSSVDNVMLALFKNGVPAAFGLREELFKLRLGMKKRIAALNDVQFEARKLQKAFHIKGATYTKNSPIIKQRVQIRKNQGRITELVLLLGMIDKILAESNAVSYTGSEKTARDWAEKNLWKPIKVSRRVVRRGSALYGFDLKRGYDRTFCGEVGAAPLKLVQP